MPGYYDVISRAVAALQESTPTSRSALYDRARSALAAQLRTVYHSLDFDRELLALEEAIRQVEQEIMNRQTSALHQATAEREFHDTENSDKLSPNSFNLNETRISTPKKILSNSSNDAMTTALRSTRFESAIGFLVSCLRLDGAAIRAPAEGSTITIERRLGWAANFFIWSALILLALEVRPVFDDWSRHHTPEASSLEAAAHFVGYMASSLVLDGSPYLLALINGLVLRRYKSRIAAALFAVFGLVGLGFGVLVLMQSGIVYMSVASIVFFGVYLAIAVWTYVALTPRTPDEMSDELGD